jgi:chromosome partitioning protein
MRVLVLTTQKGGAGKTTLAASIAVAAAQNGERVHAIDLDPQVSLYAWGQRRERSGLTVVKADPADLKRELARARQAGATLAVVDTPGLYGAGVTLALGDADLCLMPVKPSILDVEASRPTVEQLRRIGRPFAFVLNQCTPASQARTLDAATALVKAGALAPSMVAARSDFLDAMTAGEGVTEVNAKGKAAQEIALLWHWIKSRIEEQTHGKAAA